MNSYRLSLGGGQQAANRTSEPFYAVWNLESHPGTILGFDEDTNGAFSRSCVGSKNFF